MRVRQTDTKTERQTHVLSQIFILRTFSFHEHIMCSNIAKNARNFCSPAKIMHTYTHLKRVYIITCIHKKHSQHEARTTHFPRVLPRNKSTRNISSSTPAQYERVYTRLHILFKTSRRILAQLPSRTPAQITHTVKKRAYMHHSARTHTHTKHAHTQSNKNDQNQDTYLRRRTYNDSSQTAIHAVHQASHSRLEFLSGAILTAIFFTTVLVIHDTTPTRLRTGAHVVCAAGFLLRISVCAFVCVNMLSICSLRASSLSSAFICMYIYIHTYIHAHIHTYM